MRYVEYAQCDGRWRDVDYSTEGEKTNICESGCGPTCAAMILATWIDAKITPLQTATWSKRAGFKAYKQGTYYAYFKKQFEEYGIRAYQLNSRNLRKYPDESMHMRALEELGKGNPVIACMGPKNWTLHGHYILLWDVQNGIAYVNDPASTERHRTRGSWELLKKEVKYYFVVERPERGGNGMEEKKVSSWAVQAWERKKQQKILDGRRPGDYMTREEFAVAQDRNDARMEQRIREILREMNG